MYFGEFEKVFFSFDSILPESIRWLISMKKYDEAEKVILKVARINKTSHKLPQHFMNEIKREAEMVISSVDYLIKAVSP